MANLEASKRAYEAAQAAAADQVLATLRRV
jgi:hypothetical protein